MYNKKLFLDVVKNLNETPKMKTGGTKGFSSNLGATNRLFKKNTLFKKNKLYKPNPLYKKKNYKKKTYDPLSMYFEDGGYIEADLTPEQINEYRKGGYIVEDISVPSLNTFAGGGEPGTYILDGYKYKKDNGGKWSYESGQPIDDGTLIAKLDQQAKPVGTPAITKAPINTKILTSKLPAEKKTFKAPKSNTFTSETLQKVASKTVPQTDQEFTNVVEAQVDYDNKKYFLAQNALAKNYDSIAYSAAQELQKKNPKLTFDEALELAKQDNKLLTQKALETTVTNDPRLIQKQAQQQGYSAPVKEATVKALDLNDPNHVEMDGRMPQTAGEYLQRGADILFNPLDAIHYGMSPTEEMPMNMYEYEKAKQQIGYEDGADKNAINEGIDFASWFTGVGQVAQGAKMLRGTGEAVYNAIQDPSMASAGNAALNVGFNALAMNPLTKFIGGKSAFLNPSTKYAGYAKLPGNTEVIYGNPYLQDAKAIIDLPGFKLAKGNVPKGGVPAINNANAFNTATTTALGLSENAGKSLLNTVSQPHVITESPLTVATPITSGRKPVALEELAINENSARASSYGDDFDDILSRDDNEIVSNVINDVRERKIGLWQTPEGQRRLQKMIDNTPSLKGQTPETMIEGIGKMQNVNNTYDTLLKDRDAINKEIEQLDIFYDNGQLSKNEYFDRTVELDTKLNDIEAAIPGFQEYINSTSGSYNTTNAISINPARWTADDISRVTSHEVGHFLGMFAPKKVLPTYLDDKLDELDLISDTSKQLTIPEFTKSDKSTAHVSLGADRGDYLKIAMNYFKKGSKGTERVPFLTEVREDMLQNGIIESEYDQITPKMVQQHYNNYKRITDDKYPLRLYDITQNKSKNFKLLSEVLNDLPTVAGAASLVDSAMSDDESNVSQAGIGAFLMAFGKKPNLKLPVKAINVGKQLLKKGYTNLSFTSKKIANEWFDVKKLTEASKSTLGKTGELLGKGAQKFVKINEKIFQAPFKGVDAVSKIITKPIVDRLGKRAGSKFVAKVKELTDVPTKENLAKLSEYEKASSVYDYYLSKIAIPETYTKVTHNGLTGNAPLKFVPPKIEGFLDPKVYEEFVNAYNVKLQAVQNYVENTSLTDDEIKLIFGNKSKKEILEEKLILIDEDAASKHFANSSEETTVDSGLSDFEYLDETFDSSNQMPPPPSELYIDPVESSSEYVSGSYRPDYPPEVSSRIPPPPGEQNITFNRNDFGMPAVEQFYAREQFTPTYDQYAEAMGFNGPSISTPDTSQGSGYQEYLDAVRDANNIENAESQNIPDWVERNNSRYNSLSGLANDVRSIRRGVQQKRLPASEEVTYTNVDQLIPALYATSFKSPREALTYVTKSLNEGIQNGPIGKIYTGSTNTSHDSYLIQMDYIFKNAGKDGLSEPVFLGYKTMNDSGYLSKLNVDKKDILKKINDHLNKLQKKTGKNLNLNSAPPKIQNGQIYIPQYGIKKIGEITGKLKKKKEGGPVDDSIEIDIPEEKIAEYLAQGYNVEQLDTPVMAYGGTPYEAWTQYTGTPWSEAKAKGLTDGSAEKNLGLLKRLEAGEFGEPKVINTTSTPTVTPYDQMVFALVKKGNTIDELVKQRVGTREGLIFKYPELFANTKTLSAPKKPGKKPGKGTTIMEQYDALSKFISPYAEKLGDAVSTAYDSWITRQSKIAEQEKKAKKKIVTPVVNMNKVFTNKLEEFKKSAKPVVEQKPVVQQKQVIEPYDMEALRAQLTQPNMAGAPSLTRQQSQQPLGDNSAAAQFAEYGQRGQGIENTSINLQPEPEMSFWDAMNKAKETLKVKEEAPEKTPIFDNSISSQLVDQELYGRQQKDNERYGKFMSRGKDIANRTDVQRNIDSEKFFADIAKPNSVIIDIGSALGNSDPKLAGVSVWELTQNPKIKQKKIKVIATDIPDQVKSFKEHSKNKQAYNIDYAEVPMTYNTPIDSVLKTKNLASTKDVYLRAANSIDLLMTVAQTKEHFYNIAKSLKNKNVTYVYNNMIWYKPSGETSWSKIGNLNNAAFDHNAASWKTDKNRKPYALINDKTGIKNPFSN